jgi:hypothetical protein
MSGNLALVEIKDHSTPRLLRKKAAAKYIGTNHLYFDEIVKAGTIPYVTHLGKTEKLYPVDALDAYISSLPRNRMGASDNQHVALKGAK